MGNVKDDNSKNTGGTPVSRMAFSGTRMKDEKGKIWAVKTKNVHPLNPIELGLARQAKLGPMQRVVSAAGAMGEPKPDYEAETKTKKDKVKSGAKMAFGIGMGIGEQAAAATDMAGGFTDIDKLRTWSDVGDKSVKVGLQNTGLPIVGAVMNCVGSLCQIGTLIKQFVDAYKDKKEDNEVSGTDLAMGILNTILSLCQSAASVMSTFSTFSNVIPVVGAVLGAIGAAFDFVGDARQIYSSAGNVKRMRAQKEAAKQAIKEKQDENKRLPQYVKSTTSKKGSEKLQFRRTATKINGNGKDRDERLDEVTQRMNENVAIRGDLEDYDITKELTGANKKRLRSGISHVVINDATHFATALAAMDPTGVGGSIGSAINTVLGLGELAKKGGSKARQSLRKRGWLGTDMNKSDDNKAARRHHLAVNMFKRIKKLDTDYKLGELNDALFAEEDNIRRPPNEDEYKRIMGAATAYPVQQDRIEAMGVGYGPLASAETADEMVAIMRQGFYRDT